MLAPITDALIRHRRHQRKIMSKQHPPDALTEAPPPVSDTEPPPTDRDVATSPVASVGIVLPPADAALAALEPGAEVEKPPAGASQPPSEFFERAYHGLLAVHEDQKRWREELLDPGGRLAEMHAAVSTIKTTVETTQRDVEQIVPRVTRVEKAVAALEKSHASLLIEHGVMAKKLGELETEINRLKEQRGAGEAAAAPTG